MKKYFIYFLLISFTVLHAEEGMWLLDQLDQLKLKEQGLEIDVDDIYHPKKTSLQDAIVWLGGCSASFVSPEGLIVTNHHCAYGALQKASTEEKDYITDGFLANTKEEEIQALGSSASILLEMKDVTKSVLKAVKGIEDPVERDKKIQARIVELKEKGETADDLRIYIRAMYKGKKFYQFTFRRYEDVRIVFAPPLSIGKYGGDIDNWMWPRHTGDFTFLRAYMAPDGSGRKYDPENVPVQSPNYLRIASEPLEEGDLTFIMGFPGSTVRWRTSHSVNWNLKYSYPTRIKQYGECIDIIDAIGKESKEGKIRLASRHAGFHNAMKNYQGNVDGMKKSGFLQNKKAFEKEFMAFLHSKTKLKTQYGDVLDQIGEQYKGLEQQRLQENVLAMFGRQAGTLTAIAIKIFDTVSERSKPDNKRDPGFSEKDVDRTADRLKYSYYSYFHDADIQFLARVLQYAKDLPEDLKIEGLSDLSLKEGETLETFAASILDNTKLKDAEFAKELFSKTPEELLKLDDPLINFVASFYDARDVSSENADTFGAVITDLRKKYIEGLYAWKGKGLYPDANSTIRLTYGPVKGYSPADAVIYKPFTTLKGVIQKKTGEVPFDMPSKLKELHDAKDFGRWEDPVQNDIVVNFTHCGDITGGNSGSPVMNAKGELIGLAFDGNYEALTGDWQYIDDLQRTISVDIRYVMFVAEKYAGADNLLKEMGF